MKIIFERHAGKIVLAFVLLTMLFIFYMPNVIIDNSTASFIPDTHPDVIALRNLEDSFHLGEAMVLGMESKFQTLLTLENVELIRSLVEDIEDILLVNNILSLVNFENITVRDGTVITQPILEGFDGSDADTAQLLHELSSWELTRNLFISENGRAMQMFINMEPNLVSKDYEQVYTGITAILEQERYQNAGINYFIAGVPAVDVQISQNMFSDASILTPLAFITTLLMLFLFFRRVGGMILPMITVIMSIIWTVGLFSILSVPITLLAAVIPVLLIAVGSAYGIHYTHHYYHNLLEQGSTPATSVIAAMQHTWVPILMAGLTTVVGFASLAFTNIKPIRDFSIFTAVGVLFAVLISLSFIPAILALQARWHRRSSKNKKLLPKATEKNRNSFLLLLYRRVVRRRGYIGLFYIATILISIYAIPKIVTSNNLIKYFSEDSYVAQADDFFRENFLGTYPFHIVFEGDGAGSMTNIDILLAMDKLKEHLQSKHSDISAIHSYTDYIKRMNQIFYLSRQEDEIQTSEELDIAIFADDADLSALFGDDFFAPVEGASGIDPEIEISDSTATDFISYQQDPFDRENLMRNFSDVRAAMRESSITVDGFIDELSRITNYNGSYYYAIPSDPAYYGMANREELEDLISQYLFLYGSSLDSWVNHPIDPSAARMQVNLRSGGTDILMQLQQDIEDYAQILPPSYKLSMTGTTVVEHALNKLVVRTQIISVIIALIIVYIILIITFRSFLVGFIGLMPIAVSVLVSFSSMGLLSITLNISTAMVASIVIGIGIDYTIHYLHAYRKQEKLLPEGGVAAWEMQTFRDVGVPILFNALSVALGFAMLLFSLFSPLQNLGLLVVLTMLFSACSALLLLPAMLRLLRYFQRHN